MRPELLFLRSRAVALVHLVIFVACFYLAFGLRFDFDVPEVHWATFLISLPLAASLKLAVFHFFGQYRSLLRYVSLDDLKRIALAATLAEGLLVVADRIVLSRIVIPRSIFFIDWGLTVLFVSAVRATARALHEGGGAIFMRSGARRVLLVGAGDAGESLLREIRRTPSLGYHVVGFLDDDPAKRKTRIGGVSVLGTLDEARETALAHGVRECIIAIPSATGPQMRAIVKKLRRAGLAFKTLPPVRQAIRSQIDAKQIRDVTIEELLGREQVRLDPHPVAELLKGKTVAVTGAAGSIGSELCRQVLAFEPARLLAIDWSENGLFTLERELAPASGGRLLARVADVRDSSRMRRLFEEHRPGVVFHAAAHKHVPLMEANPCEAVKNNVLGTRSCAEAALRAGAGKFVLISTDKAADPVGVMGMTKRAAELYVRTLAFVHGADCVAVRFGNVLGSSCSVVPVFKSQIEKGGPVTVTHPEMTRFFMTIAEAVGLVLQAAAIGRRGQVLVLDMGEPVKIVELARELIALAGLREPEDIRIEFTGIRPGERLHESLFGSQERAEPSAHPKIKVAVGPETDPARLDALLAELASAAESGDDARTKALLAEVVGTS